MFGVHGLCSGRLQYSNSVWLTGRAASPIISPACGADGLIRFTHRIDWAMKRFRRQILFYTCQIKSLARSIRRHQNKRFTITTLVIYSCCCLIQFNATHGLQNPQDFVFAFLPLCIFSSVSVQLTNQSHNKSARLILITHKSDIKHLTLVGITKESASQFHSY